MTFKEVLKCRFAQRINIPKVDGTREEPIGKWFPLLSLFAASVVP
jgi:hypothetical protein